MHYVPRRSHRMQKHKFGITYHGVLFVQSVPVKPEHENSASMFRTAEAPEYTTKPADPNGCQNTSSA
jgi:hypothetical protein